MKLISLGSNDHDRHAKPSAEWILDAGNPHLEWLYLGDRKRALDSIVAALRWSRSELWIGHVTAALYEGQAIGGFVALPGRELADRRTVDVVRLISSTPRAERDELRRRLALGRDLYLPVQPDDRFLSKIGLLPAYRGRGLGATLLDACIAQTWEIGYTAIRLDVNSADDKTVALYTSRGFQMIGSRTLQTLNVEYVAMALSRDAT